MSDQTRKQQFARPPVSSSRASFEGSSLKNVNTLRRNRSMRSFSSFDSQKSAIASVSRTLRVVSLEMLHPTLNLLRDATSNVKVIKLTQGELKVSFSLVKNTAQGASASIFKSYQDESLVPCAVKRIHASAFKDHETELNNLLDRERFALKHLSSQAQSKFTAKDQRRVFVTEFLGFFDNRLLDEYWIIQEFCDCGSLLDFISQCSDTHDIKANKYVVSFKEISAIISSILCGLEYMHDLGYIHGDIKSANILIASPGVIKLCDFGLSTKFKKAKGLVRRLESTRGDPESLYEFHALGTVEYMAPEMIRKSLALDDGDEDAEDFVYSAKVDIWAVGILTLELLLSSPPMYFFRKENEENFSWYIANMLSNLERSNYRESWEDMDAEINSYDARNFYSSFNSGLYYLFNKNVPFVECFSTDLIAFDESEYSDKSKLLTRLNMDIVGRNQLKMEDMDALIEEFSMYKEKPSTLKYASDSRSGRLDIFGFANKTLSRKKVDYSTFSRPLRSTSKHEGAHKAIKTRNFFEVKRLLSFVGNCLLIDQEWRPSATEALDHPFVRASGKQWKKLVYSDSLEEIIKQSKRRQTRNKALKDFAVSSTVKQVNKVVTQKMLFQKHQVLGNAKS